MATTFKSLKNLPACFSKGTDLSHHNDNVHWDDLIKEGLSFVYIKTSEGVGTPDKRTMQHAMAAKKAGLQVGYYHFGRPDTRNGGTVVSDALAEAHYVLGLITHLTVADLPLVLDLEDQPALHWDSPLSPQDYNLWAKTFLETIEAATGKTPVIYSRKEYLDRKLPANHSLGKYKLWLSRYNPDSNLAICPRGWTKWDMWQFCEDGCVGGNPKLDLNVRRMVG